MIIQVKLINGKVLACDIESTRTVWELKHFICDLPDITIEPDVYQLIYLGETLHDAAVLHYLKINKKKFLIFAPKELPLYMQEIVNDMEKKVDKDHEPEDMFGQEPDLAAMDLNDAEAKNQFFESGWIYDSIKLSQFLGQSQRILEAQLHELHMLAANSSSDLAETIRISDNQLQRLEDNRNDDVYDFDNTFEQRSAINRMVSYGFSRSMSVLSYTICEQDERKAVEMLLKHLNKSE